MTNSPATPRVVSGLGDTAAPAGTGTTASRSVLRLDQRTYARTRDCVQCGLCLPACPTYLTTGQEADSPRGRIRLIKGLADGRIEPTSAVVDHLDQCLDCRGCETACPSDVVYHELLEETRAQWVRTGEIDRVLGAPTLADRLVEAFINHVLPYPRRLKLALAPAMILQRVGLWQPLVGPTLDRTLPPRLLKIMRMLPPRGTFWRPGLAERYRANGPTAHRKATVALFTGCVGSALFQQLNRQTISLLQYAGCDVIVPPGQRCCGAIYHHSGHVDRARTLARANLDTFLPNKDETPPADYTVNLIAGCGAMLKQYAHLLRDDRANADRARTFADRVRDITELLVELAPPPPGGLSKPHRPVTYHDACHLAHAQQITGPPRQVLSWIKGLKVIPLPESDMCCGAAGSYNLTQPHMAAQLGQRKVEHIQSTGARVCVTGNAGCAMQISSEAVRLGIDLEVVHPVTLLHEAYLGTA